MNKTRHAYNRSPRGKYSAHKNGAKHRGIKFELTFDEWWALWEPYFPGNRKYAMARYGDTGPYAKGNVRIITSRENAIERGTTGKAALGEKHPFAKLVDEDIPRIRDMLACGVPMTHIAKQFQVSVMVIMGIKTGKYWRHVAHV